MMRKFSLLLVLFLVAGLAQADTASYSLDAQTVQSFAITIAPDTKMITVSAKGSGDTGKVHLLARPDSKFDFDKTLDSQAAFQSSDQSGSASLSIANWSHPALHAGTWYFAVANTGTTKATGTLTATQSTSSTPDSVFKINFSAPSGNANIDDCDVGPWTDKKLMKDGKTTLGDFRKDLLKQAAANLASEIHTPVPIRVQACWKAFDDSGAHAGSYTLAAAGPTNIFAGTQGMPASDDYLWYSKAAAQRLAGTRMCDLPDSVGCAAPDIVVRYNKARKAIANYTDEADAPLIISVTMHELTHGLGFLSMMSLQDVAASDNGGCAEVVGQYSTVKVSGVCTPIDDAYTRNAGHVAAGKLTAFADMTAADRAAALTDTGPLVWLDKVLAANLDNDLYDKSYPGNLVQLYKADEIQGGSTLSHLNALAHPGQLMDAVIQRNNPSTLGLAEPMLQKAGWSTGPVETPISGTWNDPAHSGHGIDFALTARNPDGDRYSVMFYTYSNSGRSEFFFSSGALRNGHYESASEPGKPAPMARPVYDPDTKQATYPNRNASLSIDFTSYAAASPACAGHHGPDLAVMHWNIGGVHSWCIQPIVDPAKHPVAAHDLNGLWNGGSADSGWGFSLGETVKDSGNHLSPVLVYYYDKYNLSRWAQAEFNGYQPGDTVPLYKITGYGRLAPKKGTTHEQIGTLTFDLSTPDDSNPPSGASRVSFSIDGGFHRDNVPVRMLSLPPGK